MAERYGGDEQALQQFVNQSPRDWMRCGNVMVGGRS
ncbi:MAG: hypothetical protein AB1609_03325 [Bacillota bacterium]